MGGPSDPDPALSQAEFDGVSTSSRRFGRPIPPGRSGSARPSSPPMR